MATGMDGRGGAASQRGARGKFTVDTFGAKACRVCGVSKAFSDFSKSQWACPDGERRCTACVSADAVHRAARAQKRAEVRDRSESAVEALTTQMAEVDVSDCPFEEEKRIAPDGLAYSRAEFIEFFGGLVEWEAATTPRTQTSAPVPAAGAAAVATAAATPRLCVGNLSKGKAGSGPAPTGFTDVRVDRQTALGNPFPMGADGHDEAFRDAVCEACDELLAAPTSADVDAIAARHGLRVDGRFRKKGTDDPQVALAAALDGLEARLRGGASLRLLCWCHPKRCHGDGIAAVLQRRIGTAGVVVVPHPAVAGPAASGGVGGWLGGGDGRGLPAPASARRGPAGARGRGRSSVSRLQGRGM